MAFHYSAKEFIKVYRKLLDWEWYTDVNTKALFLHCLLRANWKAGEWHGIHYNEGEFITSLPMISKETGLTIQQARTALLHLQSTGEITSKLTDNSTGKRLSNKRIITVNNWNSYQGTNSQTNSQINSQNASDLTGNQQAMTQPTNSRYKNIKNKRTKEKEKENIKEKESGPPSPDGSAATLEEKTNPDDWWDSLEDETPEEWRRK